MTGQSSLCTDDRSVVTLLTLTETNPADESRALALLHEATRRRIAAFQHPARRRQTLWGRLIALAESRRLGEPLCEEPPYPPYLYTAFGRRSLSIAHTGNVIALGVASSDDPVMGLDVETLRPVRSIEGMSRMIFGEAAESVVRDCREAGNAEAFFRTWGMKESEVKLNRGSTGYRLALGPDGCPCVLNPDGRPLLVTHLAFDALRLTVLTTHATPVIRHTTDVRLLHDLGL